MALDPTRLIAYTRAHKNSCRIEHFRSGHLFARPKHLQMSDFSETRSLFNSCSVKFLKRNLRARETFLCFVARNETRVKIGDQIVVFFFAKNHAHRSKIAVVCEQRGTFEGWFAKWIFWLLFPKHKFSGMFSLKSELTRDFSAKSHPKTPESFGQNLVFFGKFSTYLSDEIFSREISQNFHTTRIFTESRDRIEQNRFQTHFRANFQRKALAMFTNVRTTWQRLVPKFGVFF